jgi:hypothetical protein
MDLLPPSRDAGRPLRPVIPIHPARPAEAAPGDCSGAEPIALRVIGRSMAPEFIEGDIVVIEPGGEASDGAYVLLQGPDGGWELRQLRHRPAAPGVAPGWQALLLDGSQPPLALAGPQSVAGVVIQRSRRNRGRSRSTTWYGP